jgi:hypothetical protein
LRRNVNDDIDDWNGAVGSILNSENITNKSITVEIDGRITDPDKTPNTNDKTRTATTE